MSSYSDIVEGDIIFRTYLKYTTDNGFGFNVGDKATWKKKGQWGMMLHSHNDLPAIERSYGDLQWFRDGREVRDNGPQAIYVGGVKVFDNGKQRKIVYSKKYLETHKCHKEHPAKYKVFTYTLLPLCCQEAYTDTPDDGRVSVEDF